jgi:uncharacterized protein YkwD
MRTALLVCAAMACCCGVLAWHAGDAQAKSAKLDRAERRIVRLVNRIRARHGLHHLRASRSLSRAASHHSREMLRRDYIGHASANGAPMGRRVRHYVHARWVGENIAITWGYRHAARRVVRMWMHSPPHRAVLLSRHPRRIGVGRAHGRLGPVEGALFTADFASAP